MRKYRFVYGERTFRRETTMNDNEMIDLFFARDPQAIQAERFIR